MRTGPPNLISPLKSQAQLEMFTRVAADPSYAAQRNISQETAQKVLAEHARAGSPPLIPGHVDVKEIGSTPRVKKPKELKLIGGTIRRK